MELLNNLIIGFETSIQPAVLAYCFIGVLLGTFIGVLPGIGPLAAISLILPITFHIEPTQAIVMLAGVYYGSEYGGATASILLNLPGTSSNAVTCIDGHPMAKQGRPGVALFTASMASLVGGMTGVVALILFAPAIVSVGLSFGAAEFFSLMVFGLVAASAVSVGSPLKGLTMVVAGLLMATVGIDIYSGVPRFQFGFTFLYDGISLVVFAMGLFGVAEVIKNLTVNRESLLTEKISLRSMLPTKDDLRKTRLPMVRGSLVGVILGAIPGAGATIASFMAYAFEKRVAKNPERFGHGAIEGVAAPESANNAAAQAAFIPTLTLGIPGSATMAVMIGALIIHGIQPGPMLMSQEPAMFWGLVMSFFIGNILLVVLNVPLIGVWVSMLNIPTKVLYPTIMVFILYGVYSVHNNPMDVLLVTICGTFGYILNALKFQLTPMLLGFVLGPMLEQNFRRALLISRGDFATFVERPLSLSLLILTVLVLVWSLYKYLSVQRNLPVEA